jgi:transcriptional regulator with XRE-family HTH domain
MESFGQALRRLRQERGMSLRALGSRVYADFSYLSQIERGTRSGSADLAARCDTALQSGTVLADAFRRDNSKATPVVISQPTPAHADESPFVTWQPDDEGRRELLIPCQTPDGGIILVDSSRRGFLQSVGAVAATATVLPATASLADALNELRSRADMLLDTRSVSSASLDSWEETAYYYGTLELTAPPETFLRQVATDFNRVQALLSQRQPLRTQQRLYRVMSQLAGMIAIVSNDVGWNAQPWFGTARRAAEEIGDKALAGWALTHQSMTFLWSGDSPHRAVELAQKAQTMAHGGPVGSLAAAMEARAQARLGNQADTLAAVARSDDVFERLDPSDTRINILGVYEHLLRFFQSNALTVCGATGQAFEVQQRALSLSQANVVDANLLRMDQAMCLMKNGDYDEGCALATRTLAAFPLKSRMELVARRAEDILHLAPPGAESGQLRDLLDARNSRGQHPSM